MEVKGHFKPHLNEDWRFSFLVIICTFWEYSQEVTRKKSHNFMRMNSFTSRHFMQTTKQAGFWTASKKSWCPSSPCSSFFEIKFLAYSYQSPDTDDNEVIILQSFPRQVLVIDSTITTIPTLSSEYFKFFIVKLRYNKFHIVFRLILILLFFVNLWLYCHNTLEITVVLTSEYDIYSELW